MIRGTPAHTCQAVSVHTWRTHATEAGAGGVGGWSRCRWRGKKGGPKKIIEEEDAEQEESHTKTVFQKKVSVKLAECGNPTDPLPASWCRSGHRCKTNTSPAGAAICSVMVKLLLPCGNFWRKFVQQPGCTYGSNVPPFPTALLTCTHRRQHVLVR